MKKKITAFSFALGLLVLGAICTNFNGNGSKILASENPRPALIKVTIASGKTQDLFNSI